MNKLILKSLLASIIFTTFTVNAGEFKTFIHPNGKYTVKQMKTIVGEKAGKWTEWVNSSEYYGCGVFTPSSSEMPYGESFEQTRTCYVDQQRTRYVYDVYNNGAETLNRTETENQTVSVSESNTVIGEEDYVVSTRSESSAWIDKSYSNCKSMWYIDLYAHTADNKCDVVQMNTTTTYNVYASGNETVKSTTSNSQTVVKRVYVYYPYDSVSGGTVPPSGNL